MSAVLHARRRRAAAPRVEAAWRPGCVLRCWLGLAACAGLKTFVPLLVMAVAARFHLFGPELAGPFTWLASTAALAALAIAGARRTGRRTSQAGVRCMSPHKEHGG